MSATRTRTGEAPGFEVEYLRPVDVEAEPLPEGFSSRGLIRSLAIIAIFTAVVVAVITLVPDLASLRDRLARADPLWIAIAIGLQVLSCLSYVVVFRQVFCRRMSWQTSTEIGFSELAANSIFSVGGAGGLALGAWILRRGGLDAGHIARRTVAFFLITSLANVGFLILAGVGLATHLLSGAPSLVLAVVPAAVGVTAIGLALAAGAGARALAHRTDGRRLEAVLRTVGHGVSEAVLLLRRRDPGIFLGAAGYMLFDVAMLGVCFTAFGNDVPPVGVLLLAYLIGQLGGLIPIPGGLGGVDGGLIGTLILYGVDPGSAVAAVIAYRGVLLIVPAVLGLPALAILRRRLAAEEHDIAACAPGREVEVVGRGQVRTWEPAAGSEAS